ncbi:MAG: SDR family NAD(P)-dependent oxidoreductase [Sphingobium sp.]|nr:SDR family NAD(P)-dependent oxidoreductase [Sphingobium sp.]
MDPNGKRAVITGGASGLGAAVVQSLLMAGAQVAVLDRHIAHIAPQQGLLAIECDITNDAHVEAAIGQVVADLGGIDICLNCAGIGGIGPIATLAGPGDMDQFRHVVDVNLLGAVNVTRFAAHHMMHNEPQGTDGARGIIINTASIASYEGQEGMGPYAASKAALAALVLVWARDLSRHNIRAMGIAPGFFETPLTHDIPDTLVDELLETVEYPRRPGRAEEFAELAMFIIRNEMLNGEVIRIDGGTRPPARTRWAAGEG